MDRRNFLKGFVGGVTSGGLLIAASPAEIEAFAMPLRAPVVVDVPTPQQRMVSAGEHLYNAQGELVAMVTDVHVSRGQLDVTPFGSSVMTFEPGGSMDIDIRAAGIGTVQWDGSGLRLRGR